LEDVAEFDDELAEQIVDNTRRYTLLFGEVIQEMLPNYKEHDVEAKDALDVYINHRMIVENQHQNDEPNRAHRYPPELMRRL
jgi:DNA replication licensing factor MCM7